ncbi:hypothetical protein B0T24DRAFT_598286 [Lasiosphaeria ovina]|uniref:Uncharacterized protein n=1 Tax=Lasiosphaeria ovina TaxID=92902 RepID=A0AAE0JV71_9PEZI|nr:hypothetical protein B0T24DRAFT_598286 [Lasiosphaeria ovina]
MKLFTASLALVPCSRPLWRSLRRQIAVDPTFETNKRICLVGVSARGLPEIVESTAGAAIFGGEGMEEEKKASFVNGMGESRKTGFPSTCEGPRPMMLSAAAFKTEDDQQDGDEGLAPAEYLLDSSQQDQNEGVAQYLPEDDC